MHAIHRSAPAPVQARDIIVTGRVQGVGYRPFVYRTAHELGLSGSVLNGSGKVFIHAEGPEVDLKALEQALVGRAPPLAQPVVATSEPGTLSGTTGFTIAASEDSAEPEIHVPPDLYTCDDCVAELGGAAERRHAYPFINCTQCGPRYTIITAMPYDRPNTSMRDFPLCRHCHAEYSSPMDRRFHAQPLACPVCGPRLEFRHKGKETSAEAGAALEAALDVLKAGKVLAVKGVGGYHLLCDAADNQAVQSIRARKRRPHKPLAVMFPLAGSDGLDAVRQSLEPGAAEVEALLDPARPIVLIRQGCEQGLSPELAPALAELGAFLPYSPLHHLLLRAYGRPVVATSGNISGEPVITDNNEAELWLGAVADAFLHHDRPIVRPADDPVMRVIAGRARPIRLGRGIAPCELQLPDTLARPMLATGGHMKNTVALAWEDRVVVSPHIGELDSPRSRDVFAQVSEDLQRLYDVRAECLVTDLHPGYAGSRWAERQSLPLIGVQHHAAHASALAGEHPDIDHWLVFTWDGVGLGSDGSLWGGEALAGRPGDWQRMASFRPFTFSGGDRAGREPWRSAAALLWADGQQWLPRIEGAALARDAWTRRINTFDTTAAGRLFDAAACLVLGRETASFEGQGPMELEQAADPAAAGIHLPLRRHGDGTWRTDWSPLLPLLMNTNRGVAHKAGAFHASMALALADQVRKLRDSVPFQAVGLSGGVFQNRLLSELVIGLLGEQGVEARLHDRIPANDGGLSFGQVIEAQALIRNGAGPMP